MLPIKLQEYFLKDLGDIKEIEELINIYYTKKKRSSQQNKALHLFCQMLSVELNEKHLYLNKILKLETEWSMITVKEYLWKPTQKALFNTLSTKELERGKQIDKIWDTLNKALIEKSEGHIEVPFFPDKEKQNLLEN